MSEPFFAPAPLFPAIAAQVAYGAVERLALTAPSKGYLRRSPSIGTTIFTTSISRLMSRSMERPPHLPRILKRAPQSGCRFTSTSMRRSRASSAQRWRTMESFSAARTMSSKMSSSWTATTEYTMTLVPSKYALAALDAHWTRW